MTDRETGRWPDSPQGDSVGRASEPRRGHKPKEGTGCPCVARPADRLGLVGGATPWSRPDDIPERMSTDGEGTTESLRIRGFDVARRAIEIATSSRTESFVVVATRKREATRTKVEQESRRESGANHLRSLRPPRGESESPTRQPARSDPRSSARPARGERTWESGSGGRASAPGDGSSGRCRRSTPAENGWKRKKRRDRPRRRGTRRPPGRCSDAADRAERSFLERGRKPEPERR
jgi:hypothetical protein